MNKIYCLLRLLRQLLEKHNKCIICSSFFKYKMGNFFYKKYLLKCNNPNRNMKKK